jgi:hypothetical protein
LIKRGEIKIAKKIGLTDFNTDSRTNICNAIRLRLLYLEKYSTEKTGNKKTYTIIPSNHPKYPFPLNLEDRIEFIKTILDEKIPGYLGIDIKEKKGGIFEDVRDDRFLKYELTIKSKPEWNIHKDTFVRLGFILDGLSWKKTIE